MERILKWLFFLLVGINIYLSSFFVRNGDILFNTEIARDFFLLQELAEKKIVLIGPSSSTGLFHGPLWTYLNLPAFLLGGGNPIIVGWFWIFLIVVFLIGCFFIAKDLFGKTTAYFYVLMTSLYMFFHANGFYNPHGAMLLIPFFFYCFVKYVQTFSLKFLLMHILLAGFIIQFQMALGIPLTILSFFAVLFLSLRKRKPLHILSFVIIGFVLSNFLVFDLRHNFLISNLVWHFLTAGARAHPPILDLFLDRMYLMVSSVEFFRINGISRNLLISLLLFILIILQISEKKNRAVYVSFLYFYVGFFVLSFVNVGGYLLYFYLFPLFPLLFLIFCSFINSNYKKYFIFLFCIIYILNFKTAIIDISNASKNIIGRDIYSWKFLSSAALKIFNQDKNFGYFVYSPNIVAYEGKYAMMYISKLSPFTSPSYFKKEKTTYLLVGPPPPNKPDMKDDWWRVNQLKIDKVPKTIEVFSNGYKIQKLSLTDEELSVPFDPNIDPGLTFR